MTIGKKLVSGFCIVLLLMLAMGFATYITITKVRSKADQIKEYTERLSLVNELQQGVRPWLVTNDFLITGAFELEGFFEALSTSLYKRIKDVEQIAISKEEKLLIKEIAERFAFIKDHSNEILRLVDSSGPSTNAKKLDLVTSLNYVVRQALEMYEYIITGDHEKSVGYAIMSETVEGLMEEISQYPHGILAKNLLNEIKVQYLSFNFYVQRLLDLNIPDPLEDKQALMLISQIDTTSEIISDKILQLVEYMKSEVGPVATMINVIRDPRTIELTVETDSAAEAMVEEVEKLSSISKHYLHTAIEEADRDKRLGIMITLIMCSVAVMAGLGVAIVISRGITKPISTLSSAAGAIAMGDLTGIEDIKSKDEIGNLSNSFNRMTVNLKKSRDDLKQSEERYRDLIENSTEMIYQTDKERTFVGINKTMLNKLGYQYEELKTMRLEDIVPVNYCNKVIKHIKKVVAEGKDSIETIFFTKKGELVYVEINATSLYNPQNNFIQTRAFVRDITERKNVEMAERHGKDLQWFSYQIISVQEEERRRISRELHDETGQALTAMKINVEIMENEVPEDLAKIRHRLAETKQLLTDTLREVRTLSFELRPSLLDHFGILAAIRGYSKNFSERTSINVEVYGENIVERFSPEIEILFYRCAQEALNNVAKHSGANNVIIDLRQDNGILRMKIKDNGKGFDVKNHFEKNMSGTRIGLFGMRERIDRIGGELRIHSGKNKGTELETLVPFNINENIISEVGENVQN